MEAQAACAHCGFPYCASCLVEFLSERHCGNCRDARLTRLQLRSQRAGLYKDFRDALFGGIAPLLLLLCASLLFRLEGGAVIACVGLILGLFLYLVIRVLHLLKVL
jgi:hypothetical protein